MNDNLDYFENIDKAIEHFSSASRDELISFLSSDDEILNQIALLNLNDIFSNENFAFKYLPLSVCFLSELLENMSVSMFFVDINRELMYIKHIYKKEYIGMI